MNARKHSLLIAFALVAVVILTIGGLFLQKYIFMGIFSYFGPRRAQKLRVRILCKTDHEALLNAGREILNQSLIDEKYFNTDEPRGRGHRVFPIPKEVQLPQIFLDLEPHKIVINSYGYLWMEMHGGMTHFGLNIYPEYFKEPFSGYKYGDRELVPCLWYYDEGYDLFPDDYDKRIDLLIDKHKGK